MILRTPACRAVLSGKIADCLPGRRCISTDRLSAPVQSYLSTSRDPFLNLSIEHHLLQKSSPDSAILFLYVNRPSIIIGRNQNPWLEVNLALLDAFRDHDKGGISPTALGTVDLVRRRSGGGTVFHDEGNVNWTFISPSADFTRDKHAEMVVRALRSCGVDRARVNERHDVVLDQGSQPSRDVDPDDTHTTAYQLSSAEDGPRPLKVSGSAYKLTRARALHHGTCLLNSPNLNVIPHYLHSPAKPFITARGVESVSSPVGNILLSNEHFVEAVRKAFSEMYGAQAAKNVIHVGEECLDLKSIRKGYEELKSPEWTFLQTPQFTLNSKGHAKAESASAGSHDIPDIDLTVRYGAVTEGKLLLGEELEIPMKVDDFLVGEKLHEIHDWQTIMPQNCTSAHRRQWELASSWLQKMLPSIRSQCI